MIRGARVRTAEVLERDAAAHRAEAERLERAARYLRHRAGARAKRTEPGHAPDEDGWRGGGR